MSTKYEIRYAIRIQHEHEMQIYRTDDPVACEEFLSELLDRKIRILSISHGGSDLPRPEFDRMVRTAAGMMTARHVSACLKLNHEEVHHRFQFAA